MLNVYFNEYQNFPGALKYDAFNIQSISAKNMLFQGNNFPKITALKLQFILIVMCIGILNVWTKCWILINSQKSKYPTDFESFKIDNEIQR